MHTNFVAQGLHMETQDLTDNVEVVDCLNQLQPVCPYQHLLGVVQG